MIRVYASVPPLLLLLLLPSAEALWAGQPRITEGEVDRSRETTIVLGSLNVHYVARGQARLSWANRKEAVAAAIRRGSPDIMALQEMETFEGGHFNEQNVQLAFLRERFPDYEFAALGDPREYPSTQPIMYRKREFQPLEQGFFFFSPTPDVIYADPWEGRYPAFCSWVRFRHTESGVTFYLYNVHFDYGSRENRLRSARLVVDRIEAREHQESEVLVVGDLNAPWFSRTLRTLRSRGLQLADTTGSTFHFYRGINLLPAIDHVLYSGAFSHRETQVLRRRFDGAWPSDHYPLFVTLTLER